jgi:fibronectin type 3 domain-containing protein
VAPANGKGVNMSWSTPASNGSPITGFRVYRGTAASALNALTTLGNVTSYKDTTTVRGGTYYYAVSAINGIGEGSRSSASSAVVAK